MKLWRQVASGLLALGAALIGLLLATRRSSSLGLQRERQAGAENQKRIDSLEASVTASQQAVVTEHKKQRDLAQKLARVDEQLAAVEAHVKGLSHDDLDAETHRALDGTADAASARAIVKPGRVIKPAN
jgi:uncharacterized coiled-coil protein SlyX